MIDPRQVALARVSPVDGAAYDTRTVREAVRTLARQLGWSGDGSRASAFAGLIPKGARVLVKPNLVLHRNHGPWGIEPLFTHPVLIRTVVEELLLTEASQVIVGDAPQDVACGKALGAKVVAVATGRTCTCRSGCGISMPASRKAPRTAK